LGVVSVVREKDFPTRKGNPVFAAKFCGGNGVGSVGTGFLSSNRLISNVFPNRRDVADVGLLIAIHIRG
jgi:hypothetical protein